MLQNIGSRTAGIDGISRKQLADSTAQTQLVLLWNGTHADAESLREEARQALWDRLQLELSMEKTHITHVTDGFDFLGFHLQWKLPKGKKPWLRVTPSPKSIERFKRTVKDLTRRKTFYQSPLEKISGLNRVLRGWNQYYALSIPPTEAPPSLPDRSVDPT